MNQKVAWIIVALVVLGALWYFWKKPEAPVTEEQPTDQGSVSALVDGVYALDVAQSSIGWTGSKTLIKEYFDNGTLSFSNGSVTVSGGAITAGAFTVDMKSLSVSSTGKGTGNDGLAGHLKSADFFDVEQFPVAVIGLKSIENGTVTAEVTIKGVTKPVTFPAAISQDGDTITASAKFAIDRTQWDIRYGSGTFFSDLGDNVIGDSVNLTLTLVATKAQQ